MVLQGYLVVQQAGRSVWNGFPHLPFPAEKKSLDRAEIPFEDNNLSPNLPGHTLAASLQDRLHDVVSNISRVCKHEESKALCCDSGWPLHFETGWLHLGGCIWEAYRKRITAIENCGEESMLCSCMIIANKGEYNIWKFYRYSGRKRKTKLLSWYIQYTPLQLKLETKLVIPELTLPNCILF